MNQKIPEILAPAGSYEIMLHAFQAGADAVYLGGQMFGARAYASNFSEEELIRAIEYAQIHQKRIYLTVNTLLKDEEIDRLSSFLKAPYEAGLHGVIVQDLGAAKVIREQFPDMELHASTQMTIMTPFGANHLKDLGINRVVPARELSLEEIRAIQTETGLEVEVFVHGALCYCYSGQCLLSSMIGGRSGNRGRCAQPCRQLYSASYGQDGTQRYYLSPKDLCGLESVPALMEAGIDSFKIEGRMKKAEYVIAAVDAYRRAVDCYAALDEWKDSQAHREQWQKHFIVAQEREQLADIFNRGNFTDGYFNQRNGVQMMALERNHHNGVYIGKVVHVSGGNLGIELSKALNPGDLLEIRTRQGVIIELTSGIHGDADSYVCIKGKQMKQIHHGDEVFRTKNHLLCDELLHQNSLAALKENIHVSVICRKDLPVTIEMTCGTQRVVVTGSPALKAEKQPLTQEGLEEKIRKTGDSPFRVEAVSFDLDSDCFFSMKEFNLLRRKAMEALEFQCKMQGRREWKPILTSASDSVCVKAVEASLEQKEKPCHAQLAVYVSSREQFAAVLEHPQVKLIGFETETLTCSDIKQMLQEMQQISSGRKKGSMLALPHSFRMDMKEDLQKLANLPVDGYLVRTLDELAFLKEAAVSEKKRITIDASVYTYNRQSTACIQNWMQVDAMTLPVEYSKEDLIALLSQTKQTNWEFVIYGRQALMVTAQCTYRNVGCCFKNRSHTAPTQQIEASGQLLLKNQFGDEFQVERICKYCYNVIYQTCPNCYFQVMQELPLEQIRTYRIHFTNESAEEAKERMNYRMPEQSITGRFRKGIE